jgi:hypothetical protein
MSNSLFMMCLEQVDRLLAVLSGGRLRVHPSGGSSSAPAHIKIDTTVIAPNPERFGANLEVTDYEPWALNALIFNNWTADAGMEPIILRFKGAATGGSINSIEDSADTTASPENMIGDGFFDGAEVRVYRSVDGRVHLLRTSMVSRWSSEPSGYRIILDSDGPAVEAGDIYFLSLVRDDVPAEEAPPKQASCANADTWQIYPNWGDNSAVTKQRDSRTLAPEYSSRTSLRIDISSAMEGGIIQFMAGSPRQDLLNAFIPGRRYQIELWLKQQNVAAGKVRVALLPYREKIQHTFTVSGDWAKYSFRFRAPWLLPRSSISQLNITFNGPGTLWVDNVHLFDTCQPAYAIRSEVVQALKDYRPGTLRIWSGQTNTAWGTTLDNWIAPEGEGMRYWSPDRGPMPGALFSLPTALAFARSTGAKPWLIVHPSFSETEWLNLLEFLAGPLTSPYGARRAACGQARPWTDEFDGIYIEYGNETWNPLFKPWTFKNGTQYGQFAEYFFQVAKSSPNYPQAGKIDFVLGGWFLSAGPRGYGARALQASPLSSSVALTTYVAGWDGDQIPLSTPDEQFQNTLLFAPWIMQPLIERQIATRSLLKKMGFPHRLTTSEGGSEYRLPSAKKTVDPVEELFGKSLAAGVSNLDALLYNSTKGFGAQAYHAFGVGPQWASHTTWNKGFRPHPAWLALQMRNQYAEGDMVATTVTSGATINLPEIDNERYRITAQPDVPMIAAYAFRRASRYMVFVLSRQLALSTSVTLHLPVNPSAATLYMLTGNPRANNIDRLRIAIRRRKVRHFTQDYSFTMPPGSVYLFLVESAEEALPVVRGS